MPTCQSKQGCDKEATYRVVATFGPDTHERLLCKRHAQDALHIGGYEHLTGLVKKRYGYIRRAAQSWAIGGVPRIYREDLRVPVPKDTSFKEGDTVLVEYLVDRWDNGETPNHWCGSRRWGFAPIKAVYAPKHNGRACDYRFLTVPMPDEWESIVASVESTLLAPTRR